MKIPLNSMRMCHIFWHILVFFGKDGSIVMLITLKKCEIQVFCGLKSALDGKKFWSGKLKAVPLRADYYQSNSLLGNAVWNLAVPQGIVWAIN